MSVCVSACVFVCVSVCSLLRYSLNIFLPQLPEVGCPIFLEIQNLWRKVIERSGLWLKFFCLEVVANRWLILPYKTWWKPLFLKDLRPMVKGHIANFDISLDIFEFLRFWWFFPFSKKNRVYGWFCFKNASGWIRDLWLKGISLILA